eukprot:4495762-Prymnesium_polylepis.2
MPDMSVVVVRACSSVRRAFATARSGRHNPTARDRVPPPGGPRVAAARFARALGGAGTNSVWLRCRAGLLLHWNGRDVRGEQPTNPDEERSRIPAGEQGQLHCPVD